MTEVKSHINPFPGIRSFETEESHLFFGREDQVETVISTLEQTHFLAIVGTSGSGKSSLIKAGVIPAILKGGINGYTNWDISVFKPGYRPVSSFAIEYTHLYNEKLRPSHDGFIESGQVEWQLRTQQQAIADAHRKLGAEPWLIVIDQFEEIFRYRNQADIENGKNEMLIFINLFLEFINKQKPDIPVYILLTLRSDFLDSCAELPGLTEALNKGHFLIPQMAPKSLKDAIVKPVKEGGDKISDELVERLLSDLGDRPDQLPVMQHALMRAWNYWRQTQIGDQPLELIHYEAVGTINSAISLHAEEIFSQLKSDGQRKTTEKLFKALTEIGSDKRGTRRPTALADILKITNALEEDVIEIIDRFRDPGCAFLLPPHQVVIHTDTVIDIHHESLMRVWGRLREWVEEETKSGELYLRLSKSAELYQQGKSGLWINPELEIAVKWKLKNKPNYYWAERYDPAFERAIEFLDYSKQESDFEIRKKEERQKRELSRARKIVLFLSIASIISILFLIIALNLKYKAEAGEKIVMNKSLELQEESKKSAIQRNEAIAQKRIAEQQQKIAEEQKLIAKEQRQYAFAQQDSARRSEIAARAAKVLADSSAQRAIRSEIVAKAAKMLADSSAQKAKISAEEAIKSEKNTKRLRLLAIARSMAIQSQRVANINPELSALLARQAYNFNLENGGKKDDPDIFNALSNIADDKVVFLGYKDVVRGVDLSKDGNWIYSGSDDGRLLVWSSKGPREKPLSLNTNGLAKKGIRCVAVQENKVLAGTSDGVILYWDKAEKGAPPQSIPTRNSIINKVSFISNNRIASIGANGFIEIWNLNDLTSLLFFEQMSAVVKDLSISGDGTKLACVDQNGVVKIYRVSQITDQPITLKTNKSLKSIALNSDGSILLTGDNAGMIHLWDMSNPDKTPLEFSDHRSAITALRFSPNDKTFASSSYDNTIRIWNPEDPKQNPIVIADNDSWVMDIAFTPNGNQLVSAGNDQTIRLFEINTDILSSKICDKVKRNLTASEWVTFVGKDIKYEKTCPQIITDK